jgi:negative regulator of sigma E activity
MTLNIYANSITKTTTAAAAVLCVIVGVRDYHQSAAAGKI